MKKKKKVDLKLYRDITVADMNVEGMPWYGRKPADGGGNGNPPGDARVHAAPEREPVGWRETWKLIGSSVIMVLLVGGVFFLFFFLLLLFMTRVWL